MDDSYRYWLAAFQHMIGTKKYSQVALVEKIKEVAPSVRITKGHLNAVYKERVGRGGKQFKASLELQEAIAKVYGFDHLEFLQAGKKIISSNNRLVEEAAVPDMDDESHRIMPLYQDWTHDDLNEIEPAEFDQKIEEYVVTVKDDLGRYARFVADRIKQISKSRNQIEQERIQLQSIIEASSDAIKVNRAEDKVVIYENQAYKRMIGRSLLWKACPGLCGDPDEHCYVDAVRIKGRSVHSIRNWNDRWYEIVANPINKGGVFHSVVAVIRDITEHYSRSLLASHANSRLQYLLNLTSDTVNFFDENKQMVGSTFHHVIEDAERPADLNSFILYAGNIFHGVTEAYQKLLQIYRDQQETRFTATNKITGKEWAIKASPIFDREVFIGIVIVSNEAISDRKINDISK